MRLYEIENFYQTANKLQIYKMVESTNSSSIKNHVLTDLLYYGNRKDLWKSLSLEALLEGKKDRQTTEPEKNTPSTVFMISDLFDDTYQRAYEFGGRAFVEAFNRFLKFKDDAAKSGNPVQPFGARDRPFLPTGPLRNAVPNETLVHAHLLHDMNLVYSMQGRNPVVYKLYGFFTHDDLGTGQPANIKKQRQQGMRFSNQTNWHSLGSK